MSLIAADFIKLKK